MLVASLTLTVGCGGGGGGGEPGNTAGTDTAPRVIGLQTPSGLQGTRGVAPDTGWINILYNLQDREYDWCEVTVEYGYDHNGDGLITDGTDDGFGNPTPDEFAPATPAPENDQYGVKVHDGVGPLNSSPGAGALHSFTWDSRADIGTGRYLTQDYVYTADGRIDKDKVTGDIRFEVFPGVVLRIKPNSGSAAGPWAYSDGMSVNNNNPPAVTIQQVQPSQGEDSINEDVTVPWTAIDPDGDNITIAVDIAVLEDDSSYQGMSPEELAELPWQPATTSTLVGEGTFELDSSPTPGEQHEFGWNSLADVQQQRIPVLCRIRPLDGKREQGDWVYSSQHFNLDNYTTFMPPNTDDNELLEGTIGAVATTLDTGNVLVTGGRAGGEIKGLNGAVVYYVLAKNPYGNINATKNTMAHGRTCHTATRLLAEDPTDPNADPAPAKVLIAGGCNENGTPTDTAELYDPSTNTFTVLSNTMNVPRSGHSAVLLRSGKVLIVGGVQDPNGNAGSFLDTAELFDPATGEFTLVEEPNAPDKTMVSARADAEAVVLPAADTPVGSNNYSKTDLVLIVGGRDHNGALKSIEVFDALTETFLATDTANDMAEARWGLSLSPTMDSTYAAVAAGGMASPPKDTIEVFDASTLTWKTSLAKMDKARAHHVGVLMGDGRLLFAGGQADEDGQNLNKTADIYNVTLEAQTRATYDDPNTPQDESIGNTPAAEIDEFIDVPNGSLTTANRDAAVTVLQNGFVVMFGGDTLTGASKELQLFAPDQGFNTTPEIEVASPDADTPEPWAFGIRIYYRLVDAEGDPARIVAQYKVLDSSNPDDATKKGKWLTDRAQDLGKWLPATMQKNTVLGDQSSGTSGLLTRTDSVDSRTNPIDNPDATEGDDLGEHLFIWNSMADIPQGNYDNVFFRIIAYGAVQGETAATSRFGVTENAPVILRIQKPIQQQIAGNGSIHGNIVVPFYLQDSDSTGAGTDNLAKIVWEYGVDEDGDGKLIEQRDDDGNLLPGSEQWLPATQSPLDVSLNGTLYQYEDQTTLTSAATGNPDVNGYPQGALHHWIWDSVYDLGAPELDPTTGKYSRTDILIRGRPYDYLDQSPNANPPSDDEMTSGIGMERGHDATDFPFEIERDPNGLWVDDWYPVTNNSDHTAPYMFNGVRVDEAIRFEFTGLCDHDTINKDTLVVKPYGGGTQIDGFYHKYDSGGVTVCDFYPQAQEKPTRTDVLVNNTGYSLEIPAYDPENRSQKVIQRAGADTDDTNALNLLTDGDQTMAFRTGVGALTESGQPTYESLTKPTSTSNVPVNTKTVELRFDERLDPLSINPSSFEVYAETFTGVKTVIPGTVLLFNKVDLTGPGGTLAKYGIISVALDQNMTLPPGSKITVVVKTGVTDLAGNSLSAQAMPEFETSGMTQTNQDDMTEEFSTGTYLDASQTTAAWGTWNGTFDGDAINGYLMGLFEYGDGSDGPLKGGTTLTANATQSAWNFTSFDLPKNNTLTLAGDRPIEIRVQGPMNIEGTIRGNGNNGLKGAYFSSTTSSDMRAGGTGVGGGGNGGGTGKYTAGQKSVVVGSNGSSARGFTGGGGGAATGLYAGSYITYYTIVPGGGGGGHGAEGTDGQKGYPSLPSGYKIGAGGPTFGNSAMTSGPEGGSGGGSGGNVTSTYGHTGTISGGSGGGGGAALSVFALGKITLGTSGVIECKGGDGGEGYYYYNSSTSNYYKGGGGGGGGSGGSVQLTGADFDLQGVIDVRGGAGGAMGSPTTSYPNPGGEGGGGRVRLSTSATMWMKSGTVSVGTSSVTSGGSYTTDWTVSSNFTVDTDNGLSGIYDKTTGEFRVRNFTLAAGAVLTVKGSKPLKIIASGNVDIQGTILAEGGSAAHYPERQVYETYMSNSSLWYFWYEFTYSYYKPGPTWGAGGPGGGTGGNNGTSKSMQSFYGWYSSHSNPMSAQSGTGRDGKVGGLGAGLGGKANYKSYSSYRYYYYAGAGAGGSNASPGGDDGWSDYHTLYGGGTGGKAQKTSTHLVNLANYTPKTVVGGAGGAGGAVGGRRYQSSTYGYNYPYGTGSGGGGGGGGVGILADGTVTLGGTYLLGGGDGGGHIYSTNSAYEGAGGAGSGGNLLVHAGKGITFAGPVIDTGGGVGGYTKMYTYTYTYYFEATIGGDGGPGAMRFTQPDSLGDPVTPTVSLDPTNFLLGGGSISSGGLSLSTDAASKFYDTTAYAPKNFEWDLSGNSGIGEFWIQGAQSDPLTGAADTGNTTAWVKLNKQTTTSVLNGFRYFRIKIILQPVSGDFPKVDSVTVSWEYDS